jgi:hypothetical protein
MEYRRMKADYCKEEKGNGIWVEGGLINGKRN